MGNKCTRIIDGVKVIAENEMLFDYDSDTRRPYYRLRGKPVTPDQAFDIIRRTDRLLGDMREIDKSPEYDGSGHFSTWMFDHQHYPKYYSWVHTDGTIGLNGITYKYPNMEELIDSWTNKVKLFPYLDLMIAITDWDELPPEVWECWIEKKIPFEGKDYDEKFYKAVEVGIHIHDGIIEILDRPSAVGMYKKYAAEYEEEDRKKYLADYYMKYAPPQVDEEYLRRCIETYGLDPENVTTWWDENNKFDIAAWGRRQREEEEQRRK